MNKIDDYFYSLWFSVLGGITFSFAIALSNNSVGSIFLIIGMGELIFSYYFGLIKKHKEEEEDETYNNGG